MRQGIGTFIAFTVCMCFGSCGLKAATTAGDWAITEAIASTKDCTIEIGTARDSIIAALGTAQGSDGIPGYSHEYYGHSLSLIYPMDSDRLFGFTLHMKNDLLAGSSATPRLPNVKRVSVFGLDVSADATWSEIRSQAKERGVEAAEEEQDSLITFNDGAFWVAFHCDYTDGSIYSVEYFKREDPNSI